MVKKILQIGAPILNDKVREVTDIKDKSVQAVIQDLLDTCKKGVEYTAGLAAPQIGVNLAITCVRRVDLEDKEEPEPGTEKWEILINPKVVSGGNEDSMLWEACLSIGEGETQLWGPVWRQDKVKVQYLDVNGKQQEFEIKGFFSHLVQHEIDHLHGILFISKVHLPEKNIWTSVELDKYLDKYDKYPPEVEK